MRLSALSTEYVLIPVEGEEAGVAADPTAGSSLEAAIVPEGATPADADFVDAAWETDTTVTPNGYAARVLVGPDSPDVGALDVGVYDGWVRWVDNPERPALRGLGFLEIF